jgi:tetratricopeptide (TPR) repeat protein
VLTLILGLIGGGVVGVLLAWWPGGPWWAASGAVVGFALPVVLLNLWLKKKLEQVFLQVQELLQGTQTTLRRKVNLMQNQFSGSPKVMQKLVEQQQNTSIRDAIKLLEGARPLYKWNFLAERQTNTLRAQLHYQLGEFEDADRYLAKCFILEPVTLAMKLSRQYMTGATKENLDKAFTKALKRYPYDKGVILYALYSWILVKQERIDEAVKLLAEVKDKAENETLRQNWEHLANGRVRSFSNAALGDQWYALRVETPKPVKAKQQRFGRF